MQEKITLESRAFQLQLPGSQPDCDVHRRHDRRREQILVCNGRQWGRWSPDREEIKRETRDEQCNRKMNDHRMLGVLRKESGFKVKWVHMVVGELKTSVVPDSGLVRSSETVMLPANGLPTSCRASRANLNLRALHFGRASP